MFVRECKCLIDSEIESNSTHESIAISLTSGILYEAEKCSDVP